MDMGLARVADDAQAIQAEAGKLFGTPYYISPEQILGKSDVDFRCDIYGLGATLYHMVAGRVPYDGEDPRAVMIKHCKQALVPPDRYNLELSFGLVKLIQRMMAKRRENRHKTTADLLEDLRSVDFLLEVENPSEPKVSPLGDLEHHMEKVIAPRPAANRPAPAANRPAPPPPSRTAEVLLVALVISVLANVTLVLLLILR
jgi:serine/threonine protein kinase